MSVADATQSDFDEFSWQTFLALNAPEVGGRVSATGDNPVQWAAWSSTPDLLNQGANPGPSGSRYYPDACVAAYPGTFERYRVLDQVGKVDDSFEEATTTGLSKSPVIDAGGNFLRYEILVSPATYDDVVAKGYNIAANLEAMDSPPVEDVNVICGDAAYTGGDPANPASGALSLKVAWMDVSDGGPPGYDTGRFHTEELLVFTPAYRNLPVTPGAEQVASCELRTMAMVGMHINHKTLKQPAWVWSTFEHVDNAPDCGAIPSGPGGRLSTTCPASVGQGYSFYPLACADGSEPGACNDNCNTPPASNDLNSPQICENPDVSDDIAWCVNEPPNPSRGLSRICRQLPLAAHYPDAHDWNQECATALGADSVWSNYVLVSTQWVNEDLGGSQCKTVARELYQWKASAEQWVVNPVVIEPKVSAAGGRPILGNTSMESYEKSNCMGCHAKSFFGGTLRAEDDNFASTDFMYWLKLEVPEAP
ncbi:MAG: hypothetical protein ABGY42_09150, partial [bacterium]